MNFKQSIAKDLHDVLNDELTLESIYNLIERPRDAAHGDYAFPVFSLSKVYKKAPNLIAEELIEKIDQDNYDNIQVVGPYLNFFVKKEEATKSVLNTILEEKNHYGDSEEGKNRNIPIDLSSPNIAKPMSMGHLRSTVIGNSIAEIVEKIGFNPIRINHIGDWGTQFGKLIAAYKHWGDESKVQENPIDELLALYIHFHEEAEKNPDLEEEGRQWFRKLEDHDEEAQTLWKWFRDESLLEFEKIYDKLGIKFDYYTGESFYNDKMDRVIDMLREKDLLIEDKNAEIVDLEKYDLPPAMIMKSDGGTLYLTRDMAAALYRKETFDFYESLYVVGNEQSMHFEQLKAVLQELDLKWADEMHHIPFGLITHKGEGLSTRRGNIILLEEVLDKAVEYAEKQIMDRNPDLENKEEVAEAVGVGAVVFHDLKNDRVNSIDFDLKEIIRSEGDTGPYVQYTRSRCESILERADWSAEDVELTKLNDDESWEVIKQLYYFPSKVQEAYEKFEPSVISKYLIDLSQKFNRYYSKHKILEDDDMLDTRLALVQSVSIVLKEGLRLLGIKSPDSM